MYLADKRADNAFSCDVELCAVRDHVPAPVSHRMMINAGLLVVRPSYSRFQSLMAAMDRWHAPGARLPEQEGSPLSKLHSLYLPYVIRVVSQQYSHSSEY
jgi:hypothetical protein